MGERDVSGRGGVKDARPPPPPPPRARRRRSALAAAGAAVALLVPLNGWRNDHTARFPDGVDLIPRSRASEDIYRPGEWEGTARHTALQLGLVTIVMAGLVVAVFALLEVRRR